MFVRNKHSGNSRTSEAPKNVLQTLWDFRMAFFPEWGLSFFSRLDFDTITSHAYAHKICLSIFHYILTYKISSCVLFSMSETFSIIIPQKNARD